MWKCFPNREIFSVLAQKSFHPGKCHRSYRHAGSNGVISSDIFLVYYLLSKSVLGLNTCFRLYSREESDYQSHVLVPVRTD